jgi:glutamate mutase epsilon subunit
LAKLESSIREEDLLSMCRSCSLWLKLKTAILHIVDDQVIESSSIAIEDFQSLLDSALRELVSMMRDMVDGKRFDRVVLLFEKLALEIPALCLQHCTSDSHAHDQRNEKDWRRWCDNAMNEVAVQVNNYCVRQHHGSILSNHQ